MCVRMSRHIQVDFLYRYLSPGVGRVLATVVDLVRVAFFTYGAILIWQFMSIVGDERDDDHQPAEEPQLCASSSSASC